jgi:competence protein ComEA
MLFCYLEFYIVKEEVLVENEVVSLVTSDREEEAIKTAIIMVDIKGKIRNPGTYEIEENSRVIDVVNLAGGLLNDADTSSINLSEKIYDEMMIIIPSKTENYEKKEVVYKDTKVSINTATLSELMMIKGIGEVKAKAIIDYREDNGYFKKIDDLKNINGIGESTFEKIKDYIKI